MSYPSHMSAMNRHENHSALTRINDFVVRIVNVMQEGIGGWISNRHFLVGYLELLC